MQKGSINIVWSERVMMKKCFWCAFGLEKNPDNEQ